MIYDNLAPITMQDLFRVTYIPRGIRFWPNWFDIPPYRKIRDINGRRVYPRSPGIRRVRVRMASRKNAQEADTIALLTQIKIWFFLCEFWFE